MAFLNAVCVETGSRSRSSSEARRVSVGSALVHLVRSALTKPASLVAESEEGSEFRAVGRNGKLCAHCVVVGAQGGGGGGRGRRKGSGLVSWNAFLLHGVMGSTFSWRRVQAGVAEMFGGQTVSFDRPPFGLSSRPRPIAWALSGESMNPYSLDFGSELTMNVMDAFKAQSAVLIGHSMGAAVAIQTAIDHPERVRALVLIAPASRVSKSRIPVPNIVRTLLSVPILASLLFFLAHGRTATCRVAFQNSISRYYHDTTKIDIDELFFGYTRAMRHSGWVRAGIACVRAMQEYDCMKEVHRLKIPVLVSFLPPPNTPHVSATGTKLHSLLSRSWLQDTTE